jgi:outer membrane receptor protein involved in Fe transport
MNSAVKIFIAALTALCAVTQAFAQAPAVETREIRGAVNDALGRPLAQAQVALKPGDGQVLQQTRTGEDGRFVFSGVAPGTYAIAAEKSGYQQGTTIVTVGDSPVPEIALALASDQALEIKVAAAKLDLARNGLSPKTGSSQYTFQQSDIDNLPSGNDTPFNDVLLRAPGVANDNFGQLHIRGDHANIQYRINNIIIPEGITGFGSALDTRFADRIDLLTGALPAQYGYRTAGVVEITTKSAYESGGRVGIYGGSHGTVQPSAELAGAAASINYYLTGSYLQSNLGLENPTGEVNAIHDHTQQGKGFAYFSTLPNPTTRINLMLGAYNGNFQIPNAPGLPVDPGGIGALTGNGGTTFDSADLNENQHEINRYGILALQSTLGADTDYQVAVFQRYTSVHFTPDSVGDPILTDCACASELFKSDTATGIQGDASTRLNERHTVRSGFFFSNESVVSNNTTTAFPVDPNTGLVSGPLQTIVDNNAKGGNRLAGVYLQDEWKATGKLTVNYGLRFDHMNEFVTAEQLSPRLGAVYQFTPQTAVHAAYARYFTPPPTELVTSKTLALFDGTSAAAPANTPNDPVLPERTNYYDVGVSHRLTPPLTLGLDAYYKQVTDLLDEGQFGPAPIFTPFNYQDGKVSGVELSANYKKDNLSAYLNLAWSRALGKNIVTAQANSGFSQDELNFIANNWVHLDHDQTYTATGGATYKMGKASFTADGIFGSGLRSGFANTDHLPAYFTMNLATTYRFDTQVLGRLDGRFAIINVFDKTYEIRDGTGIGVGPPAFGERRGYYAGISKPF